MRVPRSVLWVSVGSVEPGKKALPRPLPAKIVKAWTDAGAEIGWTRIVGFRMYEWSDKHEAGSVPTFESDM
jgi:hypothetical protein